MSAFAANDRALKAPGRAEARALGALLQAGAGFVALSLVLPHPSGGDTAALILTASGMAFAGALAAPRRRLRQERPPGTVGERVGGEPCRRCGSIC